MNGIRKAAGMPIKRGKKSGGTFSEVASKKEESIISYTSLSYTIHSIVDALVAAWFWVPSHVSGTDSCHLGGWRETFITLEGDGGSFCQVGGHLNAPI